MTGQDSPWEAGRVGPDGLPPITLVRVGFWSDYSPNMPHPRDAPRWETIQDDDDGCLVGQYLRHGSISYDGGLVPWDCLLCHEKRIGDLHFSDGVYEWLEGLDHYVHYHQLKLPSTFVNHAVRRIHLIGDARRDESWWQTHWDSKNG